MEFYEKTVNYFKFFEDIKLLEPDHTNNKLAIVFYGKENMIHIFDLRPYTQYKPFHKATEEKTAEEVYNQNIEKMLHLTQSPDLLENSANKFIPANLNLTTSQNEYSTLINIFKDINPNKYFDPLFHTPEKKSKHEKKSYSINELKKTQTDEFSYFTEKNEYEILIKLKKPEIKSRILSVIQQDLQSIMGLKWFDFQISQNKPAEQILMSLTEDGLIYFYRLKKKNFDLPAQVEINKLSSNPFTNLEEEWSRVAYFSNEKPIKDFWFSERNNNIYILNIDNNINFYEIEEINKPAIVYRKMLCFNLFPGQNLNRFTLNSEESFIFGFFDEGFRVFKNSQPFHRLYSFSFNDLDYLAKFNNYLKAEEKSNESNVNGNYIYDINNKDDYFFEFNKELKAHKNKSDKVLKEKENKKAKKNQAEKAEITNKQKSKQANGNNNHKEKIAKQKQKQQTNLKRDHKVINPREEQKNYSEEDQEELEAEDLENSNDLIDSEEAEEFSENYEDDLDEIYDFIDFNEKMVIQDNNFISNNVQKGLVSLDKKFVLFSFFSNRNKKFYLVKFYLNYFTKKITEYDFFKKCHNGQMPDLCQIVMSSCEQILFTLPPALYLKNILFTELEAYNFNEILNTKLDVECVKRNVYCPLAVINKEVLYFIELNQNFEIKNDFDFENNDEITKNYCDNLLDKYTFSGKDCYCYEGLSFKWLYNNTLLISAEDKLMRMIKFTYDQFVMGLIVKKDYQI